ncbi:MAG: hypothetical protein O7E51_13565 [Acidobacteria bacterium]|nr:hypothetical protein [Acidobacteriota bacterium]
MKRNRLKLLGYQGLCFAVLTTVCFAGEIPAPRFPDIPAVRSAEDLQPGVRTALRRYNMENIEAGASVLLVTDRTLDPLLAEAFQKYVAGRGARIDVVVLNGFPDEREPAQLLDRWGDNWWPQWLWKAATEYDYLLNMTYLVIGYTYQEGQEVRRWLNRYGVRPAMNIRHSVEKLAYRPYAQFPEELILAINRKVVESVPRGRVEVNLTSPQGTDLWLEHDYTEDLEEFEKEGVPRYSMQISAVPTRFKNARGKIVTSGSHVGMLKEPVTLWIENSQVQRVEGGNGLDVYLNPILEKFDSVDFGTHGGPGIRWVEEITFTSHPKQFAIIKEGDAFSGLFDNWSGAHYRSGAIHIAIGGSQGGPPPPAGIGKGYHFVFELYFPTLVIGGRTLIENGRLLVLDDPEVRALAGKLGSSEDWLKEAWIPAVPGINTEKASTGSQ